ncbi:MAG: 2-C-methyl-D-erythritol 2,4-cyclodiphosphate synthase [Oscillospiraceae bacterium]|nr:2-C-methyl-D-erythritol 2,4-cyclodiphosphate synthase [Oscillospiraceae bacterium]
MFRVGNGYDVHKFESGRKLVLGGVPVAFELGLAGHSDADVLIHAVTDALLGAAALGDIGTHFPASDARYKNINSGVLLEKVVNLLFQQNWLIGNIDGVIVAEKPELSGYILGMRKNISKICRISVESVSVKATTEEGLGLAGRGIGAHCTVLIHGK